MFLAGFPAGPIAANCYVLAAGDTGPCLVVDPGQDAAEPLHRLLSEHDLRPAAVLLTHGHVDHVADARVVADGNHAPVFVHAADRHLLTDPAAGIGPEFAQAVLGAAHVRWQEPALVRELAAGPLEMAGLRLTVTETPGHTPGSVTYAVDYDGDEPVGAVVFAGDLVFAGSIGRTDLPGGDPGAMQESLRTGVLTLPDDTVLLPGHGDQTSVGAERRGNPYLVDL